MEEEFLESDVVFSDVYKPTSHSIGYYSSNNHLGNTKKPKQRRQTRGDGYGLGGQSPPLDIPSTARYSNEMEYEYYYDDYYDNDNDNDEDLRVPPHVIVARRINNYYNVSRKMACSFCIEDEKGRILKGRNLCEVRNSILRLTGFYET